MNQNKITDILGYCFKRRFLYIGWLVVKRETTMLYADNNPYMTIAPDMEVAYLTFGLTTNSVLNKLRKKAMKLKEVKE